MMGIGKFGNHTYPGWDEKDLRADFFFTLSVERACVLTTTDLRSMIADDTKAASLSEVGVIVSRHCLITRQLIATLQLTSFEFINFGSDTCESGQKPWDRDIRGKEDGDRGHRAGLEGL